MTGRMITNKSLFKPTLLTYVCYLQGERTLTRTRINRSLADVVQAELI